MPVREPQPPRTGRESVRGEDILGYAVFDRPIDELVAQVMRGFAEERPSGQRWLACINPHSYSVARADPEFRAALERADWLVPDGSGIVLASRLLGGSIRTRITGSDVFEKVSAAADGRGRFSAMFVGSTASTLEAIADRYRIDFPNAHPVTTFAPPFRSRFAAAEIDEIAAAIRAARPDLLWVGLTAPKQELLLAALCKTAPFGFAGAIGAVFDFYAGTVRRSPEFFRKMGLEWLPRLARQPRKLWRRTLVSAPIFLGDVLRRARSQRAGKR